MFLSPLLKLILLSSLIFLFIATFPISLIVLSFFLIRLYLKNPEVDLFVKIFDLRMRFDHLIMGAYAGKGYNPKRYKILQTINWLLGSSPPQPENPPFTSISNVKVKSLIDDYEIPMRILVRESAIEAKEKLPIVYHLFPGGFMTEVPLRNPGEIMDKGAIVVTMSYRLAPMHKFPTQVEDSYSCLSYIANKSHPILKEHWDGRLILWGASAGGNVAACSALLVKDRGLNLNIPCQILCCPALFYTEKGLPSQVKYKNWYFHGEETIKYINSMVMRDAKDYENPYLCPIKAESLKGLPEAYFVLGERDYFCSEGEVYAQKLREAGVVVDVRIYPAEHAFDASPSPVGRKAKAELLNYLKAKIDSK